MAILQRAESILWYQNFYLKYEDAKEFATWLEKDGGLEEKTEKIKCGTGGNPLVLDYDDDEPPPEEDELKKASLQSVSMLEEIQQVLKSAEQDRHEQLIRLIEGIEKKLSDKIEKFEIETTNRVNTVVETTNNNSEIIKEIRRKFPH